MTRKDREPVERVVLRYQRDVEAFFRKFFPLSAKTLSGEPMVVLSAEAEQELVTRMAQGLAESMVRRVASANAATWRSAAGRSAAHGKLIYEVLRMELGESQRIRRDRVLQANSALVHRTPLGLRYDEIVQANARLLQRMPERIQRHAEAFIGREQRKGRRASDIEEDLRKLLPRSLRNQTKMLARTAVGRAETALMRARSERLGIEWYQWATSEDQRVRVSHKHMDDLLVTWEDAPNPEQLAGEASTLGHYHPGVAPNCRCLALPLISLDEVQWPHRVYSHGQIQYVSRGVFERWIRTPAAA